MGTNVTNYSGPQNYQTIYINCRKDSEIDGSDNPSVPTTGSQNLQAICHIPDTWTLVYQGVVLLQDRSTSTFSTGEITFTDSVGNRFDQGELLQSVTYTKETTQTVTEDVTVIGTTTNIEANPISANISSGWVQVTDDTQTTGTGAIATLTDNTAGKIGIIENGQILAYNLGVSDLSTDSEGNLFYTDPVTETIYTRQRTRGSFAGYAIYNFRKKEKDTVEQNTSVITTQERTFYDFYAVDYIAPSERNAFGATAFLLFPSIIIQRSLRKGQGKLTGDAAVNLQSSHIRLAKNIQSAEIMQQQIMDEFGVEVSIVPVNLEIGAEFVEISLNQVRDVSLLNLTAGHGLISDGTTFNSQFIPTSSITGLSTVATSGAYSDLTGTPTLITQSDIDASIAALVDAAPTTLDTLNELAAALGDDANFSTTITNSLATKADSSSLATVATSGSYDDLTNKPTISGGGFTTGGSFTTNSGSGTATIGTGATNANKPVFYFGYNFHTSGTTTTDANGAFTVAHGSSSDPERWYYVV